MGKSSAPIVAERVFRLKLTHAGWRLQSSATEFVYEGPVARDAVPPWTADEWAEIKGALVEVVGRRRDSEGDWEETRSTHLNIPEADIVAFLRGQGAKLALYRERQDRAMHHGFHAFRPGQMLPEYAGFPVVGDVELYGRVVEYERGYRAQGVRIRRLTLRGIPVTDPPPNRFGAMYVAMLYGMDTTRLPQGDIALAPAIVKDLETTYQCDVVEDWERHRGSKDATPESVAVHQDALRYYISPSYGMVTKWPTSDEKSKSMKSNWMRRTLHAIGKKLQSV